VIDYLMVLGLTALLVVLSLPTIIELVGALDKDQTPLCRAPLVKSAHAQLAGTPLISRLSAARVQPLTGDTRSLTQVSAGSERGTDRPSVLLRLPQAASR